jgi:hypothetical protein
VRTDTASPGKGPALNWLFDRLQADGTPFDSLVIVDADTTLHADFLRQMAAALDGGAAAAQAYYAVHDPGGSTSAALRSAALACRHNLRVRAHDSVLLAESTAARLVRASANEDGGLDYGRETDLVPDVLPGPDVFSGVVCAGREFAHGFSRNRRRQWLE